MSSPLDGLTSVFAARQHAEIMSGHDYANNRLYQMFSNYNSAPEAPQQQQQDISYQEALIAIDELIEKINLLEFENADLAYAKNQLQMDSLNRTNALNAKINRYNRKKDFIKKLIAILNKSPHYSKDPLLQQLFTIISEDD